MMRLTIFSQIYFKIYKYQIINKKTLFLINSNRKTGFIVNIGIHDYSGINNSAKENRLCMIH
ncbi:hypothetical protein EHH62_01410 [Salmonella enterica subsp. arizonae serovar 40:z36:-]|uniref:Uncharacterized protein n=1 Tax=Salmonella enterica TaxID=28901 RepID=A0A5Y7W4E3_SALER|nr:hypothetical protein [Salmonella enterica]EBH9975243.1 hypothetical protein [Salmonella enterica subsp. arizonae serovar 40:z36:-]EDW8125216.1 hypothetical protein [Salmonella enterica subsp. salamae]EAX9061631.1 hypothetical protein [Salmonella enterica]EAZ8724283.1 hypothetical protein [Salmonella enterica]